MSPKTTTEEGKLRRVPVMIPPSMVKQLDQWRGHLDDVPNRSEAIRRILADWMRQAAERKGSKQR
jgi:Arc/MetJ-type ribon-helix-helix transcriptional regulator